MKSINKSRRGPKTKLVDATRRNINIQPQDYELLQRIGSGNASEGLMLALKQLRDYEANK